MPKSSHPTKARKAKTLKPQRVNSPSDRSRAPSPYATVNGLTVKQWRFVDAYMGEAGGNATDAARIAGYGNTEATRHVAAVRLMADKKIRTVLQSAVELHGLSAHMTIHKLSQIIQANIGDFLAVNHDGSLRYDALDRPLFDLERARRLGKLHLIEKISVAPDGHVTIALPKRTEALALMAKYHGLLVDRVEIDQRPDAERVRVELVEKLNRGLAQLSLEDQAKIKGRSVASTPNGQGGKTNDSQEGDENPAANPHSPEIVDVECETTD